MFAYLFAVWFLACSAAAHDVNNVTQAFDKAKIVPDVLPSFGPTGILNVAYGSNGSNTVTVTPGMNLSIAQATPSPNVSLWSNDTALNGKTFVLVMIDPDAPSSQNTSLSPVRHYLASGLKANGSLAGGAMLVNNTPAISNYIVPSPPAGSGPHRYILLLYVQSDTFAADAVNFVNASTSIYNFNITKFTSELDLGSPVAGSFFYTGPTSNASSTSNSTATNSTTTPKSSGKSSDALLGFGFSRELNVVGVTLAASLLGFVVL